MLRFVTLNVLMMGLIFKISNAQNLNIGGIFPTLDHSGKLNTRFDSILSFLKLITVKAEK